MDLKEIVMRLNGPVQPTGRHEVDEVRLENMKALTTLVDELLFEIDGAARAADRPEASMKAIGDHARDFMKRVGEGA